MTSTASYCSVKRLNSTLKSSPSKPSVEHKTNKNVERSKFKIEQQMYKGQKPQESNSSRPTLQQSLTCAACHLLRLLTDAHHDLT